MKTKIKLLLGGLLIAGVSAMPAALVVAQENPDTPVSNADDITTQQADRQTTLEERLAERKAALIERLTAARETRIAQRCVAAQGKIRAHEARITGVATARQNAYTTVTTKLDELVQKLKAENIDTTQLEAQLTVLKTKITAFQTDVTEYKQIIVDLAALDCTADPEAFHASLEAVRTLRTELVAASTDIKMHIQETIKPILVTIKESLQAQAETGGTADETETQ